MFWLGLFTGIILGVAASAMIVLSFLLDLENPND